MRSQKNKSTDRNKFRRTKSRTWQVKAYELTVNLGRMLDVEAVLTLDAEADTKFCFTLYHGYQVKSVTSLTKDISVSFTQGKICLLCKQIDRQIS